MKAGNGSRRRPIIDAKACAAREGCSLAGIIQDALVQYLHDDTSRGDALRACEKFCSHRGVLAREKTDGLLQGDQRVG